MGATCALILLIAAIALLFSGCPEEPLEALDAVDNVRIMPSEDDQNQIILAWDNPAQMGLRAIEVRWTIVTDDTENTPNDIVRIPNARPNERMRQSFTVRRGVVYRFRIAGIDSNNNASPVQQVQYITAPVDVRAQLRTDGGALRVLLTWTAIHGATEYYIYRAVEDDNNFVRLSSAESVVSASYEDSAVNLGRDYTYRIRAIIRNEDGTSITEGEESATVQATIGGATPTGITINPGYQEVTLRWDAVEGATKYHVYRAFGAGGMFNRDDPPHAVVTPVTGVATQIYVDTINLSNNGIYKYRIGTLDQSDQEGNLSAELVTQVAPAIPQNLVAEGNNNAVELTWKPSVRGADSYRIYRAVGTDISSATLLPTNPAKLFTTTYTDNTVTNGTEYTYSVRAVTADGTESTDSNTATATPIDESSRVTSCSAADSTSATARYTITFTGNWSTARSGGRLPLPSSAHFTTLTGTTHNNSYTMWRVGSKASPGVEQLAETGGNGTLKAEISRAGAHTDVLVEIGGLGATGSRSTTRTFNKTHTRLSLESMIAPTADWFVGLSSYCLLDSAGNWKSDETIMLRVYDAGTEQDTPLFSLGNPAENPHKDISIFPGNDDAGFRVSDSGSQYIGSIRLQKI